MHPSPSVRPNILFRAMLPSVLVLALAAALFAQQGPLEIPRVDSRQKASIIDSVTAALNEVYVFADVAKKMERLVKGNLKEGKYDSISSLSEFTMRLTEDLRSVSRDRHLMVGPLQSRPQGDQRKASPEEVEKTMVERYRYENFGFRKVEILPGNIGYLDLRYFGPAKFGGATAIAAMNYLAGADAIIFDLRQNNGGEPSMIQLITSYLFDEPVHLNDFYIRRTNETQQFWTQASVQGPRMPKVPVYVLTSSGTFSGAEEFSYNLKNLKRGTIIGEVTGGGAHPVDLREFENVGVAMNLPYGRAVNPITGTNWEGKGVEPDIKVKADQALLVARSEAVKKLIELTSDEAKKNALGWTLETIETERNPVSLDERSLKAYTGTYGPRKIFLENKSLCYQREGRPKYRLIPLGNDKFMVESLETFRVKFTRDSSDKVVEFIGLYSSGESDANKRTGD